MHPAKAEAERIRALLVPLIDDWQAGNIGRLLSTTYIIANAAHALQVSGGAVRKHLTAAVSDGSLIEILVRRDWLVQLPGQEALPDLYAMGIEDSYLLVTDRPYSRGSNGISFLITPRAYKRFITLQRRKFKVKRPSVCEHCGAVTGG